MNPDKITYFGETDSRNKRVKFGIKSKDRTKHMYVIGKTGMGKSTLLENMAIQDIQSGEGVCYIDPHGATAEKLLDFVPEHRIKDVVYFAPFDTDYPIAFNVMEDVGADKRHLVVSGLMSTFEKIWEDAWSARMAYILQNTLLALLEFPGSTLLGVNRMYTDKDFRKQVVDNVKDVSVRSFWVDEYAKYTDRYTQEATPAIQNKIGQFASNPLIRNIIGQAEATFDLRKIMDEKKILIVNLSKGRVGEGNARLLGSMMITKIYLAAMSRADKNEKELSSLPNFYLHVDEFQSFANKSFADILSEARKYKLNLTMAHQYIEQMEEEVRNAVFGNVGTMVAFRVGAYDAEVLEKEFAPTFTAEDLVNLGFIQVYLKLMIDGVSSAPFSATTMAPIARAERTFRTEVIDSSRAQFARPKAAVETTIEDWHGAKKEMSTEISKDKGEYKREYKPASRTLSASFDKQGDRPFRSEKRDYKDRKEVDKTKKEAFEEIMQQEKGASVPPSLPAMKLQDLPSRSLQQGVKKATPAHVSQLKDALAQLTKKDVSGATQTHHQPQKPPEKPQEKVREEPRPAPKVETQAKKHKHEIPEDELLNLLKVDGE